MAKISDDIRDWCEIRAGNGCAFVDKDDCDKLSALADRIDRELMERPRTTDGAYIHVGDTAYLYDGRKVKVNDIRVSIDLETCDMERESYISTSPMNIANERPDSFERIADDIQKRIGTGFIESSALGDLADRIRKLAEKEGERA